MQRTITDIRAEVSKTLRITDFVNSSHLPTKELELNLDNYLKSSTDRFDLTTNIEVIANVINQSRNLMLSSLQEVSMQLWATLYDYPCLKTCQGLTSYISDCIKLAWALSIQAPPFVIEYETRSFRSDMHVRFHTSSQESGGIKMYLWPSLLESHNGSCVHKGVVIT